MTARAHLCSLGSGGALKVYSGKGDSWKCFQRVGLGALEFASSYCLALLPVYRKLGKFLSSTRAKSKSSFRCPAECWDSATARIMQEVYLRAKCGSYFMSLSHLMSFHVPRRMFHGMSQYFAGLVSSAKEGFCSEHLRMDQKTRKVQEADK